MKATIATDGVYFVTGGDPGLKFNGLPLSSWDQPLVVAGNFWMTRFREGDTVETGDDPSIWTTIHYLRSYDWNGLDA